MPATKYHRNDIHVLYLAIRIGQNWELVWWWTLLTMRGKQLCKQWCLSFHRIYIRLFENYFKISWLKNICWNFCCKWLTFEEEIMKVQYVVVCEAWLFWIFKYHKIRVRWKFYIPYTLTVFLKSCQRKNCENGPSFADVVIKDYVVVFFWNTVYWCMSRVGR